MPGPIDDRPWAALPAATADALRPELPLIAAEAIEAISHAVPDYARPLEGEFGKGLRRGVELAMRGFVDLIGSSDSNSAPERQVYVELGRGEMRAGRRLDALLAAYRVGARVAWRRMAAAGEQVQRLRAEPRLLAESIFAYIDSPESSSM